MNAWSECSGVRWEQGTYWRPSGLPVWSGFGDIGGSGAGPETTGWGSQQGGRQDGFRLFSSFFESVKIGKSVRLDVLGTWMKGYGEIETGENKAHLVWWGFSILASWRYSRSGVLNPVPGDLPSCRVQSNPNQTHLSVIIKCSFRPLISWFSCVWVGLVVLELNSAGRVGLQEQGWAPLF